VAFRVITVVVNASTAGLTAGLGRAAAQVAGFQRQMGAALGFNFSPMAAGVAGLTVALGYSVSAAIKFESRMRNVASISPEVARNFEDFNKQVLELSRHLPTTANDLAEGFYQIVSSGFQGKQAMEVLNVSAKAATAGLSTTSEAVTAVTSVLNAYGLQANQATRVSDALFNTVNYGIVTFPQLTSVVAHFAGIAARAGVSIEEAGTAVAVMTRSGLSASEAGISLNRVLTMLIDPSKALSATARSLGVSFTKELRDPTIGLKGVMMQLLDVSKGNIETLLEWFPEIRAARGALALMTDGGKLYNTVFNQMGTVNANAGATQRAFNEQSKATSVQLKELWNRINAFAIETGTHVLPVIREFADWLGKAGHTLSDLGSLLGRELRPGFESLGHAISNLTGIAKELWQALGPILSALAGAALGAVIASFRGLAAALQGVTGFIKENHAALAALAALIVTVLVARLALLAIQFGSLLPTAIGVFILNMRAAAASVLTINPLIGAFAIAVGALTFSFVSSRQESKKFSDAVRDLSAQLTQAKATGADAYLRKISEAIAPMSKDLTDAGVKVPTLVNSLSQGGRTATDAWTRARDAVLDHAKSMGVNGAALNTMRRYYDIFGQSLASVNSQTGQAKVSQTIYNQALDQAKAKLSPIDRALADLEVKQKNWNLAVGNAAKELAGQNDLLAENTRQQDINARKLQEIIRANVMQIAAENKNIAILTAQGVPAAFIQELIKHGPAYVAAAVSMGKSQVGALAQTWEQGQQQIATRQEQLAALEGPKVNKEFRDSVQRTKDIAAQGYTTSFIDQLRTAVANAKTIAASGGQTTVDEFGRKVHNSAGQMLLAYLHSLPEPLRTAVTQAIGVGGKGGQDTAIAVANGIISQYGLTGKAAQGVKDRILDEFRKIAPGIDDQKGNVTRASQGIATALNNALNGIGHKVDIDVQAHLQSIIGKMSQPMLRASGGRITGPGTGTSDEAGIFALSNDEWVIRSASSRYYGHDAMRSVNEGTATIIPGFATGGRVGRAQVYNFQGHPPSTDAMAAAIADKAAGDLGTLLATIGATTSLGSSVGAQAWAGTFLQALLMAGQSPGWLGLGLQRLGQESGGNPLAVNRSDINWLRGTPSVGLMQVIGPTFQRWAGSMRGVGPFLYGTSVNPLANIYAAIRYTLGAYGTLSAWGRPGGYASGLDYVPFDNFPALLHRGERVVPAAQNSGGGLIFAPNINIKVMGGDDPQATARALQSAMRSEVQGQLANFVRQLKVGTGRY
jgi:TP901 family phage tail tape measure protein